MARLLGPDAGSRLVYAVAGVRLQPAVGDTIVVYSDAAGTNLADIAAYQPDDPGVPGGTVAGSTLTVDATSQVPLFWFPADGTDTLYVRIGGGPVTKINADYDARLDAGTGAGTVQSVNSVLPDLAGNVALTAANVGAAASSHSHAEADVAQLVSDLQARIRNQSTWLPNTAYAVNDLVVYAEVVLICSAAHTSVNGKWTTGELANWSTMGQPAHRFNIRLYGAQGDGQCVTDGSMTAAGAVLTSASGKFTAADVGKAIMVQDAGPSGVTTLSTTIASYQSATQVTLAATASTTVTGTAWVMWGTDDTAAIQAATNAGHTYAATHAYLYEVYTPAAPGLFYTIAGPLVTGGTTHGCSQITIPIGAVPASKVSAQFTGAANGSANFHWQQTMPQFSGSTWLSFGLFSSLGAQVTSITNNGDASVLGGPLPPQGYGTNALLYSNIQVTVQNMSILVPYSTQSVNYGALNFTGCAEAVIRDSAVMQAGNFAKLQNSIPLSAGLSIGIAMPANGNNDLCVMDNVTIGGGFTFALFATEHLVVTASRIIYCWAAVVAIGTYQGSVGASHEVVITGLSVEGCIRHVYFFNDAQGGQGPTVTIYNLDTEGTPIIYDNTNSGAGGHGLGTIYFTGYNAPQVPNPTGAILINLIQQPGPVATPTYTLGTAFMNPYGRKATVMLTGGTVTAVKRGTTAAGAVKLWGSAAPTMTSFWTGALTGALTFTLLPGEWVEIDGSAQPSSFWVLE